MQGRDRAFLGAMRELQAVRDFAGSPGTSLARTDTKHGEIAEQVHVGVSRAMDVLHGRAPTATFDGVPVQSKYHNGLRKTLSGVASHAEQYPEVQRGRVHETLHDREGRLVRENEELRQSERSAHGPSLTGLGTAAALGAATGGGSGVALAVWAKCRQGRSPFRGEFSMQDWKEVGVVAAKGAAGGAVAGSAIYVLTNATALAAPFAGSLAGALNGIGAILQEHQAGTIDGDEFVELSHVVALDAAAAGLALAAGQTLVPIPMLGALLGTLAGRLVASALRDGLGKSAAALVARLDEYERDALGQLDEEYRALVQRLDTWSGNLKRLAETAFDPETNTTLRLQASVGMARTLGVPEDRILRTTGDLDAFMRE